MAERRGFEPPIPKRYTSLPSMHHRPLGHLSAAMVIIPSTFYVGKSQSLHFYLFHLLTSSVQVDYVEYDLHCLFHRLDYCIFVLTMAVIRSREEIGR